MNKVIVVSLDKRFKKFEKKIKRETDEILKILGEQDSNYHQFLLPEKSCIEIYLVGDKIMRELNGKFRAQNKPTNILSFPEPKDFPHLELEPRFLGEIYLDIPYIKKEGKFETARLLAHGILHLLGYSHKKKDDRIKMEKKEDYVFHRFRHRVVSS